MAAPELILNLLRNDCPEIQIFGELIVVDDNAVLHSTGFSESQYPARSLLKPFQWLACGHTEHFSENATQPDIHTTALGSMVGEKNQIQTLHEWTAQNRLSNYVEVPESFPADSKFRAELKVEGKASQKEYHYCFSKHYSILLACEKNNWPLEGYRKQNHPFHKNLEKLLSDVLAASATKWVLDGCGLPTPVLTLKQMAELYRVLALGGFSENMFSARNRMLKFPEWIGGEKSVDTMLMKQNPGQVISKLGADGLLALGVLPTKKYPQGLGIVLKLSSDITWRWALPSLQPLMSALNLKCEHSPTSEHQVSACYVPFSSTRKILDISPLVSNKSAVWPGDVHFKRKVSVDVQEGSHMTLSAMETTMHVGAHADAPNHFSEDRRGIDAVELEKYFGDCQVVEVSVGRGTSIKPKDFADTPITQKRILFKTNSFQSDGKIDNKLVSVDKETIEFLGRLGVCLVGIDTPSVDAFKSKTLDAHKATLQFQMAILEGLDSSAINPGIYKLSALPLRLRDADASPLRAILTPY